MNNKLIMWIAIIAVVYFIWHKSGYKMPALLSGK